MAKLYMAENSSPAEGTGADAKEFTMDGELGVIVTTGNTETSTIKAKINAHQELEQWSNDYIAEGLYRRDGNADEEKVKDQKVFVSAQGSYKLENPNHRLFAYASYEDNRFSGYDYQGTLAGGWGQQLWKDESSSFNYSIGPGYSFAKTDSGESQNGLIVRGAADYQWKISDTSTFRQLLSTEVGQDNTKSKSETSLTAKINGSLAMKVTLTLNHNSQVAEDKENLDTETAVTLVYTFF
ncbi:YdiY family protein [Bowmanella sp. JS7-9]|uniref:YdiY family protein n=1 Tax=Pseudobowmanella zhangzhouensis TaxID=1537679 RepID=A0ABW1XFN8_9ALTE|nr:DUF481 domain-containing protein [Bowmanella sp. JS7-9]TBX21446.1 hypothetical protein TK45_12320 [Bowmanella sp. JS7-9]